MVFFGILLIVFETFLWDKGGGEEEGGGGLRVSEGDRVAFFGVRFVVVDTFVIFGGEEGGDKEGEKGGDKEGESGGVSGLVVFETFVFRGEEGEEGERETFSFVLFFVEAYSCADIIVTSSSSSSSFVFRFLVVLGGEVDC